MNMIVAVDRNWGIGYHNKLLVSIPATFRAYRLIEVKLANYLSKKRVPQNL